MKSLLYTLFTVLLSLQIFSQPGWIIQAGGSVPYNNSYCRDIQFVNDMTGWVLLPYHVKHTTNGGAEWNDYSVLTTYSYEVLYSLFFINEQTGWIAGGKILRTTNSGRSWVVCDSNHNLRAVHFVDPQSGWAGGESGKLLKTSNGGLTWDSIVTGETENFNALYFTNQQTGFVGADWGKILRTTNAGLNWSVYYDNVTYSFIQSIKFTNSMIGIAVGSGGYVYSTYNGGNNWIRNSIGISTNLRDISFANDMNCYACGSNGDVFRSTNSGGNWVRTQSAGLYSNTQGISALSGANLWLIADSGTVYKSINSGQSWEEKLRHVPARSPLYCIRFVNDATGYTCGDAGVVMKTTNGGQKWTIAKKDTSHALYSLHFINSSTGVAVGGKYQGSTNVILRTTNGGTNWSQVFSDQSGIIKSVFFINSQTGWCTGTMGLILKTTNSGVSWTKPGVLPFSNNGFDIEFINASTGFVTRDSSDNMFKTTNGGVNWSVVQVTGFLRKIHFINESTGFAAGSGRVVKTTNSGNNWSITFTGISAIQSICFPNANSGWISARNIGSSTNGGANWSVQLNGQFGFLHDVFFVNDFKGWVCGYDGIILHTSTAGIGINTISSQIPESFRLYQNYPNPFNPITIIRFDVSLSRGMVNSNFAVKIYDVLGREVSILLDQALLPGTYEVDFDGTNYPSGIYFCRLSAGKFSETIKMILLK